ncbi:diguanylate cyclase [Methylophaga sp. OBS3]|uniref:sensor domain-containing diguanylate cyclase n=1 Tax=Methylophaga sp. OBS3 TaxID=2991934 RepID=UPI002255FBE1|nr:diguanylate cyclase [Methylophaga sp. OBS3]
MNRIKARIMLICTVLVLLTVVALQVSNWWFIRNYHQQQLAPQVEIAGHFLQQYITSRETNLLRSASVVTQDFGFRQALSSADLPTITSMLDNHSQRLSVDLFLITKPNGEFVASNHELAYSELLQHWFENDVVVGEGKFVVIGGKLFRCFILPVNAPRLIAYAMVGYELNTEVLQQLQNKTGLALHFVTHNGQKVFSSMPEKWLDLASQPRREHHLQKMLSDNSMIVSEALAGVDEHLPIKLYLQPDMRYFDDQFQQLHYRSLLTTLIILVLAVWLSSMLARRLGDPLSVMYQDLFYRANYDQLTGILNRPASLLKIQEELGRLNRSNSLYCIALFDVDKFKSINDNYGHAVGDVVLKKFADRIKRAMREFDVFGRFGGEEFIIGMAVSPLEANMAFERLRHIIDETPIDCRQHKITVTTSCGVCSFSANQPQPTLDQILETADKALYQAKSNGRNQVVFAELAPTVVTNDK